MKTADKGGGGKPAKLLLQPGPDVLAKFIAENPQSDRRIQSEMCHISILEEQSTGDGEEQNMENLPSLDPRDAVLRVTLQGGPASQSEQSASERARGKEAEEDEDNLPAELQGLQDLDPVSSPDPTVLVPTVPMPEDPALQQTTPVTEDPAVRQDFEALSGRTQELQEQVLQAVVAQQEQVLQAVLAQFGPMMDQTKVQTAQLQSKLLEHIRSKDQIIQDQTREIEEMRRMIEDRDQRIDTFADLILQLQKDVENRERERLELQKDVENRERERLENEATMNALSRDVECRDEALKASKNASLMRVKEKHLEMETVILKQKEAQGLRIMKEVMRRWRHALLRGHVQTWHKNSASFGLPGVSGMTNFSFGF